MRLHQQTQRGYFVDGKKKQYADDTITRTGECTGRSRCIYKSQPRSRLSPQKESSLYRGGGSRLRVVRLKGESSITDRAGPKERSS